jgi:hypothetical protein
VLYGLIADGHERTEPAKPMVGAQSRKQRAADV